MRSRQRRGVGGRLAAAGPLTYLTLVAGLILSIGPLYWMLVVASHTTRAATQFPPPLLPGGRLGDNVARVFANENAFFVGALFNSVLVAGTVTVSVVFFATLAGFAFAKLRFRGRNALLLFVVATMMVPVQLGLIPLYMLMVKLGWTGTLTAVIVPFLVSGFGVFMMRQYAGSAVPDDLIEAARIDGCSTWRIYWNVVLPALRPAAAVLALFTFMQTWNEFLWPLVVLNPDAPTVQYSLNTLAVGYYTDYAMVLAGTAVGTAPLLIVFVLFGRQIIGGIMEGALRA